MGAAAGCPAGDRAASSCACTSTVTHRARWWSRNRSCATEMARSARALRPRAARRSGCRPPRPGSIRPRVDRWRSSLRSDPGRAPRGAWPARNCRSPTTNVPAPAAETIGTPGAVLNDTSNSLMIGRIETAWNTHRNVHRPKHDPPNAPTIGGCLHSGTGPRLA